MRRRLGEGVAFGFLALFLALVPYTSAQRQMFGRWSYTFTALLVVLLLGGLAMARFSMTPRDVDDEDEADQDDRPRVAGARAVGVGLDFGVALWGLGYLIGSIFDPASRGRLLRFDFLQSVVPAASLLEWAGFAAVLAGCAVFLWAQLAPKAPVMAMAACGLLALLVAGEGGARWMASYHPRPTPVATSASERWERLYVDLNLKGFRDRAHSAVAASGTRRLLVVGGSEAFGAGIDAPEARFSDALASQLSVTTGTQWEAINVGIRGADAAEQIAALKEGLQARPDVVLLLDSFDEPGWSGAESPASGPRAGTSRWSRLLAINSVLYQELSLRFSPPPDDPPIAAPVAEDERVAALRRFVRTASAPGRVVAIVPVDVEVSSDIARRTRYRAFVQHADSLGLPVWGIDRAFRGQSAPALLISKQYREPNALAHRLMADEVAARLAVLFQRPQIPVLIFMP